MQLRLGLQSIQFVVRTHAMVLQYYLPALDRHTSQQFV